MRFFSLLLLTGILHCLASCTKSAPDPSQSNNNTSTPLGSNEKTITNFSFKATSNTALSSDAEGLIGQDTIKLTLPNGVVINNLTPSITYTGKTITPQSNTAQDFSIPVTYTVTANDGTTRKYIVVVKTLPSSARAITAFVFKAAANPGLASDITANIQGDSINANLPYGANLSNLIPMITITGVNISPGSGSAQNFSHTIPYTVTAQDGTTKTYKVNITQDSASKPGCILINSNYTGPSSFNAGKIYALDAVTGKLRWKYAPNTGTFISTPAFSNGVVFTANWNEILAIDTNTKTSLWNFTAGKAVRSAIAVAGGILYANCDDGYLYALDAGTGSMRWRYFQEGSDTLSGNLSSPTVVDGVVYFGSSRDSYIYALDAATGALKWKTFDTYALGMTIQSSPSVAGGVLYIGDNARNVLALDIYSGAIKWDFQTGDIILSSPTVLNGTVYIGSTDKTFYALDAASGKVKWQSWTGQQVISSPILSKGIVYFGTSGGGGSKAVYALDASTGNRLWVFTFGTDFNTGPVVFDDKVFILGYNNLFALDAVTGNLRWSFQPENSNESFISAPIVLDQQGTLYYPADSGQQN